LRAKRLALSALVALGRHTVTGLLTTSGRQFVDWSADYRLFGQQRFNHEEIFSVARNEVLQRIGSKEPFVALMDDTLLRKRGRKIHGTSWRRDPLGPPFCSNFIWGQRFLQISAALPESPGASRARAIPIDFLHCPSPRKPTKRASPEEWVAYKYEQKRTKISSRGAERLWNLRDALDTKDKERELIVSADGGFTNGTVLKNLPPRTTFIGRIRKDAKLYAMPAEKTSGRGRKPVYGERLPTPEEIRKDDSRPWQTVQAFAAGSIREFQIKTIAPVRWRSAGGGHDLRLLVIRPLAYRLNKKSRLNYRKPAYLICTDPNLAIEKFLQNYIWRWEVEVNFRDEKTLLGTGQAQVRTKNAVELVPSLIVAAYALLLLAGDSTYGTKNKVYPKPKWRKKDKTSRVSTEQLIGLMRTQLWGKAMGLDNFYSFASQLKKLQKAEKIEEQLPAAVMYATG